MLNFIFNNKSTQSAPSDFQNHYAGNWVWRAVAALIDDNSELSIDDIANKLKASPEEITEALNGLQHLGVIHRSGRKYKKILKYTYFTDKNLSAEKLLTDHVQLSTQILDLLKKSDSKEIFYRTSFIGTTEKKFKEFCLKLESLMREFLVESSRAPAEKVYALSLSCADVMRSSISENLSITTNEVAIEK